MSEELERVEREILSKRPSEGWKIRRIPVPNMRVKIVKLLYEKGEPMTIAEIAYELGSSYSSIRSHLRALEAGKVICGRLAREYERQSYFTICPVCPLKDKCEYKKEMVWKNVK